MTDRHYSKRISYIALALGILLLPGVAQAIELRSSTNLPSLQPKGVLIIGGITGASRSDSNTRNCYGSTLCKESGSYYSEHNILHYKKGEPMRQRSGSNSVRNNAPGTVNNSNHQQWCANQYNSYRPSDNSYQPFTGSRQNCSSPFQ